MKVSRCMTAMMALAVPLAVSPLRAQDKEEERAPGCYLAGGIDAFQKGNLSLAESEFRGAVRTSSGMLEARENLAITLAREGKLKEAATEFDGILSIRPDWPEANYNSGSVLLDQNDLAGAEHRFPQSLGVESRLIPRLSTTWD